ncbi:hypothetical protein COR50_10760 [Chitinophaga caeni]|uniref:Uncharacterized protein n=1 Tax=Chitinophaga caeni TaxID=2029983 RepID=A0A291QUJ5_9BACT|nr:DUF6702 family protein [Chitinophaga caeni]ATL47607.1 hypothetical protein COR50_10760 [Chitinophaga caeni]
MGVLICKWFLPIWMMAYHPFYVSVTEIKHNKTNQSLEISCRIFYDDLENAVKQESHTNFDIMKPKNRVEVDSLLSKYVKSHFRVMADQKGVDLKYLGYQIEEDAAWIFFEGKPVPAVHNLQVHNDILYAQHKEQIHMLHVIVDGKRKSTKIENPDAEASLQF